MKRSFSVVALIALFSLVLAACGGGAPAPGAAQPTNAPAPTAAPTNTPVPTPTPAPTATPTPAVSADPAEAIPEAMKKTGEAKTYRFELTMSGTGVAPSTGTDAPPSDEELVLFGMSGEVNEGNSHLVLKGLLSAFLGADPEKGLEFLTVDEQGYVRGPVAMMGAPEDRWYILSDSSQSPAASFGAGQLTQGFDQNTSLEGLEAAGTEQLDNLTCQVYRGDKEATLEALGSLGSSPVGGDSFQEVEQAETKFYICDDGYFHKLEMNISGKTNDGQDASLTILFRIYDYNATDIVIEAPADAAPQGTPTFPGVTP